MLGISFKNFLEDETILKEMKIRYNNKLVFKKI